MINEKYKTLLDYVYLRDKSEYYNTIDNTFKGVKDMIQNYYLDNKSEQELRKRSIIEVYENSHFSSKNKKGYYNMLKKEFILKASKNPELDSNIEMLFNYITSGNKESIDYLHKIIYYKYLNIDTGNINSLILYGVGGSGKTSLVLLLKTIFSSNYVLTNFGQKDLEDNFDLNQGNLLIAEYAEINGTGISSDKNSNRMKNLVMSEENIIHTKHVNKYKKKNTCWYIITSNNDIPLKLDNSYKENRRYSVFKSNKSMNIKDGENIYNAINNKKIVSNYLAWLKKEFPEVEKMKSFYSLENNDKKELEILSNLDLNQDEKNNLIENLYKLSNILFNDFLEKDCI